VLDMGFHSYIQVHTTNTRKSPGDHIPSGEAVLAITGYTRSLYSRIPTTTRRTYLGKYWMKELSRLARFSCASHKKN